MRSSTSRLAPALALTVALAAGCADDGDDTALDAPSPTATAPSPSPTATSPSATATSPTPTTAPSPTPTSDTREWATCVSTRASLQVSYPADWTVRDYPDGGCAYFDPEPFEVERGTEAPSVAVRLDVENVEYERVRRSYVEDNEQLISERETEVAGYPAVRVEDRDTEGPLAPKGRRLTYIADLGQEKTLLLTTNETDADDLEQAKDVLDEMAERLERAS